jgi:hypothetical protein
MKKKAIKPTHCQFNISRQVCNLIPEHGFSEMVEPVPENLKVVDNLDPKHLRRSDANF